MGSRRQFLVGMSGAGVAGLGFGLGAVVRSAASSDRQEVAGGGGELYADAWVEGEDTPLEDLMREHAVLERLLLVYEEGARRLEAGTAVAHDTLASGAAIVRRYIEDHHERDEEVHIFPRLQRVGVEEELIKTLLLQHVAGRALTSEVMRLATPAGVGDRLVRARLVDAMRGFIRMYRPHAAHENTVLFPAFRRAVSQKEYEALQVALERSERAAFGDHLYASVLEEVAGLERSLGIGELAAFTPSGPDGPL